jgi:voltage-gated potassium channel
MGGVSMVIEVSPGHIVVPAVYPRRSIQRHRETVMLIEDKNALDRPLPAAILATLIVLSVVAFSIETVPDLDPVVRRALWYFEIFVVSVFTLEYVYRVATAKDRLKFITSFSGIIDLLAILPFYLSLAVDLRSLRVIRLLRLLRLFKLARYNSAFERLYAALLVSKSELLVSTSILCIAIYLAAFGIYQFEHAAQPDKFRSIFDALWWAVATVTTVGYGDIYPITIGGRLFTFVVLLCSLGLVAVPTGIFASALLAVRSERRDDTSGAS